MEKPVLWIATSNQNKAKEYQELLPNFEVKTLNDLKMVYLEPVENGLTFSENALIKAKSLALITQELVVGDDSGICVDALNGFPGIYSKRWATPVEKDSQICQMLLDKLAKESETTNRKAMMQTSLSLYNPKTQSEHIFEGKVHGKLAQVVKLGQGFGYDLIFQPGDSPKTYSEMGQAEKNKFSARQIAAVKLQNYLESLNQENEAKN